MTKIILKPTITKPHAQVNGPGKSCIPDIVTEGKTPELPTSRHHAISGSVRL